MEQLLLQIFQTNEGMSLEHSTKLERSIILYDLHQLDLINNLNRRDAEELGFYLNPVSKEFCPIYIQDKVINISFKNFKNKINKLNL